MDGVSLWPSRPWPRPTSTRGAYVVLQVLDLLADGARGDRQLVGGAAEVHVPGGGLDHQARLVEARTARAVDALHAPRRQPHGPVGATVVGVALAKQTLAQADLDAGRLAIPFDIATAVDFAYYIVHPKAKGRLSQVKAFVSWLLAEAEAHEQAHRTIDMGAGI